MGDSTHPTAAAPASVAPIRPPHPADREHPALVTARSAILDLVEEDAPNLVAAATSPDVRGWHLDPTLVDVTREVVATTIAVARHADAPTPADMRVFRLLGARCGDAHVALHELDETVDTATRTLRQAFSATSAELDELFGPASMRQTVASLCNVADTLWRAARSEARSGREAALGWRPRGAAYVGALHRALSGGAVQRPTVVPCPLNSDRPSAVAVFTRGGRDATRQLREAAHVAEVLLPATSVGLARSPQHARIVVEQHSRSEWLETTAMLHEIARWHGLHMHRTTPVRFEELGAAYRDLRGDLSREASPDISLAGFAAAAVA